MYFDHFLPIKSNLLSLIFWKFLSCFTICIGDKTQADGLEEESMLSSFYRIEWNLRQALKPGYEVLFERLNTHPGGLKFLTTIRADILSILA